MTYHDQVTTVEALSKSFDVYLEHRHTMTPNELWAVYQYTRRASEMMYKDLTAILDEQKQGGQ